MKKKDKLKKKAKKEAAEEKRKDVTTALLATMDISDDSSSQSSSGDSVSSGDDASSEGASSLELQQQEQDQQQDQQQEQENEKEVEPPAVTGASDTEIGLMQVAQGAALPPTSSSTNIEKEENSLMQIAQVTDAHALISETEDHNLSPLMLVASGSTSSRPPALHIFCVNLVSSIVKAAVDSLEVKNVLENMIQRVISDTDSPNSSRFSVEKGIASSRIQKIVRGFLTRSFLRRQSAKSRVIQCFVRCRRARKEFARRLLLSEGDTFLTDAAKMSSGREMESYTGSWMEGQFHGKGKYIFADGSEYQGRFEGGTVSGPGSMMLPDGEKDNWSLVPCQSSGLSISSWAGSDTVSPRIAPQRVYRSISFRNSTWVWCKNIERRAQAVRHVAFWQD